MNKNSAGSGDPSCTLVLKNLNFNLKQEKLLEMLAQMGIAPQSVNYHYDQNGNFCGIAFAKYKRVEDAAKALEQVHPPFNPIVFLSRLIFLCAIKKLSNKKFIFPLSR